MRSLCGSMLMIAALTLISLWAPAGQAQQTPTSGQAIVFGSGTPSYVPLWITGNKLGNSLLFQSSGANVGLGTTAPVSKLDVVGDINFSGSIRYQGSPVLRFPVGANVPNLALGPGALVNTSGGGNSAIGHNALTSNTTGDNNTAVGYGALFNNIAGGSNSAIGLGALYNNTTGNANTATGLAALTLNTTGNNNTASGYYALFNNTTGGGNTATGLSAMYSNTTGNNNTASGVSALASNTAGNNNTAIGETAMFNNTTGYQNTASGLSTLYFNTTGNNNTASGYTALQNNTTGNNNIAIGYQAGFNVTGNSNNIHIGNQGSSNDNGAIRIGTSGMQSMFFAAGVRGILTSSNDAVPVMIDSNGQLGTGSSSMRFKQDVQDMGGASRDLMRLRPVTFRYQKPFEDGSRPMQYGLIAEEVADVYPDLVAHSADGQIETVKYQVLDVMLLNEVQLQKTEIVAQRGQMRTLEQQIKEQQERLAKLEGALNSLSNTPRVP